MKFGLISFFAPVFAQGESITEKFPSNCDKNLATRNDPYVSCSHCCAFNNYQSGSKLERCMTAEQRDGEWAGQYKDDQGNYFNWQCQAPPDNFLPNCMQAHKLTDTMVSVGGEWKISEDGQLFTTGNSEHQWIELPMTSSDSDSWCIVFDTSFADKSDHFGVFRDGRGLSFYPGAEKGWETATRKYFSLDSHIDITDKDHAKNLVLVYDSKTDSFKLSQNGKVIFSGSMVQGSGIPVFYSSYYNAGGIFRLPPMGTYHFFYGKYCIQLEQLWKLSAAKAIAHKAQYHGAIKPQSLMHGSCKSVGFGTKPDGYSRPELSAAKNGVSTTVWTK